MALDAQDFADFILPEICQHIFINFHPWFHLDDLVVRVLDHEEEDVPEQVEAVEDDGDDAEGEAASSQLRNKG